MPRRGRRRSTSCCCAAPTAGTCPSTRARITSATSTGAPPPPASTPSSRASRGIRWPEGTPEDPPAAETVQGLANRKNLALLRHLEAGGVKAHESARHYLEAMRDAGLHAAVVSASANSAAILERAGLTPF